MTMIGTVVHSLDNLAPLLGVIDGLGSRHVGYGVRDEHYAQVGEALLWTLEQGGSASSSRRRRARPGRVPMRC